MGHQEQHNQESGPKKDRLRRFQLEGQRPFHNEVQTLHHQAAGNSGVEIEQRQEEYKGLFQVNPL